MECGIDIKIGEDRRPRRKLILKILKKFREHTKSLDKMEKEAERKLGLKKPSWLKKSLYKTYDEFLIKELEYKLAIASYVAYKYLELAEEIVYKQEAGK